MSEQESRQSPEERDAEIERLRTRIALLENVAKWARIYLTNSTPSNAVQLDKALNQSA